MRGLVVFDHLRSHLDAFRRDTKGSIDSGLVKPMDDIVNGLDNAPAAFNDIFMGRNFSEINEAAHSSEKGGAIKPVMVF